MKNKKMVSLKIRNKTLEILDDISDEMGLDTRAQSVTFAARLTKNILEIKKNGKLVVEDENGNVGGIIVI